MEKEISFKCFGDFVIFKGFVIKVFYEITSKGYKDNDIWLYCLYFLIVIFLVKMRFIFFYIVMVERFYFLFILDIENLELEFCRN